MKPLAEPQSNPDSLESVVNAIEQAVKPGEDRLHSTRDLTCSFRLTGSGDRRSKCFRFAVRHYDDGQNGAR